MDPMNLEPWVQSFLVLWVTIVMAPVVIFSCFF